MINWNNFAPHKKLWYARTNLLLMKSNEIHTRTILLLMKVMKYKNFCATYEKI